MVNTLRDFIQRTPAEIEKRVHLCRSYRVDLALELKAIQFQPGAPAKLTASLIAAVELGIPYPELMRVAMESGSRELAELFGQESVHEREVWTSYTISHDEPGYNSDDLAWIELRRTENRFRLELTYTDGVHSCTETVALTPEQAAQYMRDSAHGGWSCQDWSESHIEFVTAELDWRNIEAGDWYSRFL